MKGKFAHVVHQKGTCPHDDDPCWGDEGETTLEIYDHTGKRTWKEDISIYSADRVSVARSDERALIQQSTSPYGILAINPKGEKKFVALKAGLYPNAISPNGRYGVAYGDLQKFVFFDVITGKIHVYDGPGEPWVNDDGKLEVWEGSSLKSDWSLGPDGKKVYEFKLE